MTYTRTGERGIVRSMGYSPGCVYVVYACGGDWANYQNYTASLTKCADLVDGWPLHSFTVELLNSSFYAQTKRKLEPQGFQVDPRMHNRWQKWTIIRHEDPVKLEELRLRFEAGGYETEKK